jgi:hypothetical protein
MSSKRTSLHVFGASTVLLAVVAGACLYGTNALAAQAPVSFGESQTAREKPSRELADSGSHLIPAVVYATADGHIHEIALQGTWRHQDLTAATGAPTAHSRARPMAYRRSDGVSMVVYRGADSHIYAIYLGIVSDGTGWQEAWQWADLSDITGSPAAASDPAGYVRSDEVSTVVYAGSDGHIHDLRLEGSWIWSDLTTISGAPTAYTATVGSPIPVGYARGDEINAIVYRAASDAHIYELRLEGGWQWADLTSLSGAPDPSSLHAAYVRSDGLSTINYMTSNGHVHEMWLDVGWNWADLTSMATAPAAGSTSRPFGYVRSDGINTVVYAATTPLDGHVHELRLDPGWVSYDLTSVGAGFGYEPVGYVRADGISAVVYKGGGFAGHIHEIRLERDGWHAADLTDLAGAPVPAQYGWPWAYNRSAVANVFLPCMVRNG